MRKYQLLICSLLLFGVACSDSHDGRTNVAPGDPFHNYDEGNTNVIGVDNPGDATPDTDGDDSEPGETPILVGAPGGGEVCINDSLCTVPPVDESEWCDREGGPVDLIYVDGELVDTICYPPADDPERPLEEITGATGDVDVAQNANKTTVVFDEATNGVPIAGDITVDGNNVAIYGNGPDNTIIDGNVALDGNNARLRGVTITGDLILSKNNVAIVLSRIMGNVRLETMSTNNSVFAENEIFGSFTSDSNGNLFVGNAVLGEFTHTGNGNTCDRNYAFADDDADGVIDDEEVGEPLSCD
jgi:hypothetical protein